MCLVIDFYKVSNYFINYRCETHHINHTRDFCHSLKLHLTLGA